LLERKYLAIDLNDVKNGVLPEGASPDLIRALQATIKTGTLPEASTPQARPSLSIDTTMAKEQVIVGGDEHLERFERIAGQAQSDIFVLSTFVTPHDDKYTERHERVRTALEQAAQRGVRCHLFYGTTLDTDRRNAIAMQELNISRPSGPRSPISAWSGSTRPGSSSPGGSRSTPRHRMSLPPPVPLPPSAER
jgi:hypothetical protein